jgi:hypothetical protein
MRRVGFSRTVNNLMRRFAVAVKGNVSATEMHFNLRFDSGTEVNGSVLCPIL